MDQDTQAVIDRLTDALMTSGLSMRQFARALGTSASRFSAYRSGRTAPSAAWLVRAERIADALARARREGIPSSIDAASVLRDAAARGDGDWTYALALEIRDQARDILRRRPDLAAAWEPQPAHLEDRWQALFGAFISHAFAEAGIPAPKWATRARLELEWVLDTPRLSDAEIKRQTPAWLADRNIFIAEKDLATA